MKESDENEQMQPQTDFISAVMEMRSGAVAVRLNEKFNELLSAVLQTAAKGKMTVEFTVEPSKWGMGGAVVEVDIDHDIKIKAPELKVGAAKFFVRADRTLSREDPGREGQAGLFETKEVRSGN